MIVATDVFCPCLRSGQGPCPRCVLTAELERSKAATAIMLLEAWQIPTPAGAWQFRLRFNCGCERWQPTFDPAIDHTCPNCLTPVPDVIIGDVPF